MGCRIIIDMLIDSSLSLRMTYYTCVSSFTLRMAGQALLFLAYALNDTLYLFFLTYVSNGMLDLLAFA